MIIYMIKLARIDYTNWRNVRSLRLIEPIKMEWNSNKYHKTPQFLLYAKDLEDDKIKTFSMDNIHKFDSLIFDRDNIPVDRILSSKDKDELNDKTKELKMYTVVKMNKQNVNYIEDKI